MLDVIVLGKLYIPQSKYLASIGMGDEKALKDKRSPLGANLVGTLDFFWLGKNYIDRQFMNQFKD